MTTEPTPTGWALADFRPETGHAHDCWLTSDFTLICNKDCSARLYAIAQDAQQRIAAVRAEAKRAQDGRGSWVHATRILAVTDYDPEDRP